MEDLVAWLRGVLDDEEEAARDVHPGPWRAQPPPDQTAWDSRNDGWEVVSDAYRPDQLGYHVVDVGDHVDINTRRGGVFDEDHARYIVRHDPAAVLADVQAKGRILARLEYRLTMMDDPIDRSRWDDLTRHYWEVVVDLARAYRHRPGWRQEWEA